MQPSQRSNLLDIHWTTRPSVRMTMTPGIFFVSSVKENSPRTRNDLQISMSNSVTTVPTWPTVSDYQPHSVYPKAKLLSTGIHFVALLERIQIDPNLPLLKTNNYNSNTLTQSPTKREDKETGLVNLRQR
jgi:hypothetical protein